MNWIVYALLAVVLASLRELLQKRALRYETARDYAVIRNSLILVVALLSLPLIDLSISWTGYAIVTAAALLGAAGQISRLTGMKHTDLSIVQPLMNIQPLLVTVLAFLVLDEALTTAELTGVLLMVAGTYVLELDHEHTGIFGPIRHLWESPNALLVILATALFGTAKLFDRVFLTQHGNALTYLVLVWIGMAAIHIFWYVTTHELAPLIETAERNSTMILWPAVLTVLAALSLYKAISLAYVGLVIAIYRLQTILTTIEAGFFLNEKHLFQKTLACTVMVAGAILVVL